MTCQVSREGRRNLQEPKGQDQEGLPTEGKYNQDQEQDHEQYQDQEEMRRKKCWNKYS